MRSSALALAQAEGLEQLAPGPGLLDRVGGERVADGVADPLGQQGGDPGGALDQPGRRRAGLGHPEVERVVEGLRGQPVGLDHERHRRRLHRDLDVVEADLGEVGQLHPGRLDQRLGRGPAVALVEVGVERAGVDPDADGHAAVLGLGGHQLDLVGLAQVPGVEPQALHAGLEGGQGHLEWKWMSAMIGTGRAGHDPGQALGGRLLVAGAAHDVGAGRGQGVDLGEGALDVGRLGGRHRLDGDRGAAADGHVAHVDLAGGLALGRGPAGACHGAHATGDRSPDPPGGPAVPGTAISRRGWPSGGGCRCSERRARSGRPGTSMNSQAKGISLATSAW